LKDLTAEEMSGNTVKILRVALSSTSEPEVLDFIQQAKATKPLVIFTPNPEFLVAAQEDSHFLANLNQADINIPDGFGLVLAGKILGLPVKERIKGADLVEKLLSIGEIEKWEVGIAGARRGDPKESKILFERLSQKYPNVEFINLDDSRFTVHDSRFGIVFACHGMIKQENWILENKDKIKARVFMGVGGSLDFLTGFAKRAPVRIRKVGFEWLWRGLQKPGHWKRVYAAVIVFPLLVIKEKIRNSLFVNR